MTTDNWTPEPRDIPEELGDEYRAESYTPEPTASQIMAGSRIMDRLNDADRETLRLWAMGGIGGG